MHKNFKNVNNFTKEKIKGGNFMAKSLRDKMINQKSYITIGCVFLGLIISIALFMFLRQQNNTENIGLQVSDGQNMSQENLEEANSSIGKSVDELNDYEELEDNSVQVKLDNESNNNAEETTNNENTNNGEENFDIQQVNSEETNSEDNQGVNSEENQGVNSQQNLAPQNEQTTQETQENVEDTPQDPVFTMPVQGEIVKHYGKEKLVYSDTLKEWTTHLGIDIKADKTTIVKASSEGCIKSIKNDPRYGLTVVIEHENGFTSVYSNLLTAEFVVVGENVKSGQTIGTVGNTATFEILDDPHLHFEILKDGNSIDPEMYIK